MGFCIYLTHPEVAIDPNVPVPDWGLSDIGRERAAKAAALPWAGEIRHVVSSGERKAVETAEIFAAPFGLNPLAIEAMHENDRSATGFLPPDEFERVADAFFADPDASIRGWERARDAQHRIVGAVRSVLTNNPDAEPVLFCGHGGVGTLLKCHLMGVPISRVHDQAGGGQWYRFAKEDLETCRATGLDWVRL
jgi:broad specificity phosphatase PhoE